jgi:hypothetical protein
VSAQSTGISPGLVPTALRAHRWEVLIHPLTLSSFLTQQQKVKTGRREVATARGKHTEDKNFAKCHRDSLRGSIFFTNNSEACNHMVLRSPYFLFASFGKTMNKDFSM